MSRKELATINKISKILPIPGMDKIEEIQLENKNWKLFAQKERFQIGEEIIHVEPGAFLPDAEVYSYLGKESFKDLGNNKGYLVQTKKTKNPEVYSEGILLKLPHYWKNELFITERLGIKNFGKLESEFLFGSNTNGTFPSWKIPYTDIPRFQKMSDKELEFFLDKELLITTKYHGETIHIIHDQNEIEILSNDKRDLQSEYTEENKMSLRWLFVKENLIEKKLKKLGLNIDIQGELIGYNLAGKAIHGSKNYLDKGLKVFIFNIYDLNKKQFYTIPEIDLFYDLIQKNHFENFELVEGFQNNLWTFNNLESLKHIIRSFKEDPHYINKEGIVVTTFDCKNKFKYVFNE